MFGIPAAIIAAVSGFKLPEFKPQSLIWAGVALALSITVLLPLGIATSKWIGKPSAVELAKTETRRATQLEENAKALAVENRFLKESYEVATKRLEERASEVSAFQEALEKKERENEELRKAAPGKDEPVFRADDPWYAGQRMRVVPPKK